MIKGSYSRKNNEGFSLIELVIVIAVLGILSAVAIPSFICIQRKAKAAAALTSAINIQKECEISSSLNQSDISFQPVNISGYEALLNSSSREKVPCGNETITLKPDNNNTNLLPTFIYSLTNKELTFSFKGIKGKNFKTCLSLVCDNDNEAYISSNSGLITTNRLNFLESIEQNSDVVMDGSYSERGCSAYALVRGSSWDEAQKNARKLGGNLTTPNNSDENKFLINEYAEKLTERDSNWDNGERAGAWIGLKSDASGNLSFANGEELDKGFNSPYGGSQENYPDEYKNNNVTSGFHLLIKDPSGHAQRHGGLNTWWREPNTGRDYYFDEDSNDYWGYNYGIAEVPIC
tara:strand:- start:101 stop:1144 length:1044 start_codon:yes stop_codon:yes gene_type:complete